MLRASSQHTGEKVDLDVITAGGSGGVPHGELLIAFADSVLGENEANEANEGTDAGDARLARCRAEMLSALGSPGLVDAAAVVGLFNAIDRVADSTGIPLEAEKAADTVDLRERLGIGKYAPQ